MTSTKILLRSSRSGTAAATTRSTAQAIHGPQTIDLTPGSYSSVDGLINNIGIAYGTEIQNAIGGSGDDTFIVPYEFKVSFIPKFDGGPGYDTAVFHSARSEYTITTLADGELQVSDSGLNPDATVLLTDIENLRFSDGDFATADPPAVVTVSNLAATHGQIFTAAQLYSARDANGDGIAQVEFWDAGTGGGHFLLNGVAQGANQGNLRHGGAALPVELPVRLGRRHAVGARQ